MTIARLVGLMVLAGTSLGAAAQSDFYRRMTPPGQPDGGTVGVALRVGPEYQGSNDTRVSLMPSIDYSWRNGWFAGVLNGVGYNASSRPDLAYGVRLTPNFGRKEHRSDDLRGMGDIDARAELGVFFNVSPIRELSLNSSLRYGSGNSRKGLVLDLGASWSRSVSQDLRLTASLATSWVNADYQRSFFGVDASQALRSGYASYAPGAGFKDLRLGALVVYRLSPSWSLTGTASYSSLLGDAKASPLVRDRAGFSGLLAAGYHF